ncbi:MAG: hypothetical protein JNK05_34910 [Myxococcales bacterium]|nr:hypothetical protein [Myxococcales bacterium]
MADSRLEQVLALVQPEVLALFPGVAFEFGEPMASTHAAPPRVAWFRAEDGSQVGPARTTARETEAPLDRSAVVVAVCWAAKGGSHTTDDAAIESLIGAVELALHKTLGTALILPIAEQWTTEGWIQTGKSARLLFGVRMPVVLPAPEIVATEAEPIDAGFDDTDKSDTDGILQAKDG